MSSPNDTTDTPGELPSTTESMLTALLLHDALVKVSDEDLTLSLKRIASSGPDGVAALNSWEYPDKKKNKVLHQLVAYKKRNVIEELVPSFLDVNVPRSSDLLTPLLLSVWKDKKLNDISELLLERGADPTLKNSYGEDCQALVAEVSKSKNIAFLDLELTDFPSVDGCKILELAIVITNDNLEEQARHEWVVSHPSDLLSSLSPWHQTNFRSVSLGGNGLFDAILGTSSLPFSVVCSEALSFVQAWCPAGKCRLAGFSVHGDREVLRREMPELYKHVSHQIIDVSSVMALGYSWATVKMEGRPRQEEGGTRGAHRAIGDVDFSIETLKFLRATFFA